MLLPSRSYRHHLPHWQSGLKVRVPSPFANKADIISICNRKQAITTSSITRTRKRTLYCGFGVRLNMSRIAYTVSRFAYCARLFELGSFRCKDCTTALPATVFETCCKDSGYILQQDLGYCIYSDNHVCRAPYSSDLRWRIVWQRIGMEHSFRTITQRLNISLGTAFNVFKTFEATGEIEPKHRKYSGSIVDSSTVFLIVV